MAENSQRFWKKTEARKFSGSEVTGWPNLHRGFGKKLRQGSSVVQRLQDSKTIAKVTEVLNLHCDFDLGDCSPNVSHGSLAHDNVESNQA